MIILLVGPHAVGKTTAVKRWVNRYPQLVGVHCDNCIVYDGETTEKEKGWQGTTQEKWDRLKLTRQKSGIFVLESNQAHGTQIVRGLKPGEPVINLWCSAQRMQEFLRARCDAKGKKFHTDYWTWKKCEYEGRRRMANCLIRELDPSQWADFEINGQERDWKIVDVYFGKLYRRLLRESMRT